MGHASFDSATLRGRPRRAFTYSSARVGNLNGSNVMQERRWNYACAPDTYRERHEYGRALTLRPAGGGKMRLRLLPFAAGLAVLSEFGTENPRLAGSVKS
jgi:hypothetical protein